MPNLNDLLHTSDIVLVPNQKELILDGQLELTRRDLTVIYLGAGLLGLSSLLFEMFDLPDCFKSCLIPVVPSIFR